MPEPNAFEVELDIEKLKNHKSPGIDQIPAELIKAGGRTICGEIHKLIISIWNKEELPDEWKESIIVPIYKKGDKTDCNDYRSINDFKNGYQPRTTIVEDDNGDLVADCHSIMARWRNYFSQLLNVYEVKDVRQKYTQ